MEEKPKAQSFGLNYPWLQGFIVAQMDLPTMQEMQVRSLGWEDPLEKGMATHSRILAWKTPWRKKPDGL